MTPLFLIVLLLAGLLAFSLVGHVAAMDRAERARLEWEQSVPVASSLPRAVAVATAWRKRTPTPRPPRDERGGMT